MPYITKPITLDVNNINTSLPYIYFYDKKFLVDTGSTKSLISSKLFNDMKHCAIFRPFQIKTAHGLTKHNDAVYCELPEMFNTNIKHTFYKFDFSDQFDGLVGFDLLKKLGAILDMKANKLITPSAEIKLFTRSKLFVFNPLQKTMIKLPVNLLEGQFYLPGFNIKNGLRVQESIVTVNNHEVTVAVLNFLDTTQKINIFGNLDIVMEPVDQVEELYYYDNNMWQNSINQPKLMTENIKNNLQTDGLNIEEKASIQALAYKFRHIFHIEGQPLTFTHCIKHKLNLRNHVPVYVRMYRQPIETKQEIKNQVNELFKQDIIQESISPWSCPVNIVTRTTNGKTKKRMVIDYRKLNDLTIEDKYPIPNISDILDKLGKCHYFSTLDLASGYHQVEMDPEDVAKTAFSTEQGHFEFKRMPFGLKNAPATFQRLMDNVLKGLLENTCFVYLDDIIIYATSLEEHMLKLQKVFKRLEEANFKIKIDKCSFLRKEIKYLGHIITEDGVKPNPEKIEAITKYPIPKTPKQIKAFLGLLGYYRKFIRNFADITKPLTKCLKKEAKIEFTPDYIQAFEQCKTLLVNEPILQYPDFNREFIITTDASNVAIGAVLSQGKITEDRPVQYASRTLSETEQRYSTIEKELLAIVYAVKTFRPYIYGRHFKIYTDHRPLVWLWKLKEPNSKLLRWKLRLEEYDFEVIYKKGKYNTNADALSRITIDQLNALEESSDDDDLISLIPVVDPDERNRLEEILEDLRSIRVNPDIEYGNYESMPNTSFHNEPNITGKNLSQLRQERADENLQLPEDQVTDDTIHSNINDEPEISIRISNKPINAMKLQYHISPTFSSFEISNTIENGSKIIKAKIPSEKNENIIFKFIKEYICGKGNHYIYFESERMYKDFSKVYIKHFNNNGPKIIRCTIRLITVKDKEDQMQIIQTYHEGKTNHRGIDVTIDHIKRKYFWKNMKQDISDFIKACETCNLAKYDRHPSKPALQLTETPDRPFRKLFMDTFTLNNSKFLTIIDAFTRLGQAISITALNATNIADALIEYFRFYGIPEEISSDSGKEFKNNLIQKFLEGYKIKIHFGTPMNPPSQGAVERFHSTLIEHVRCLQEQRTESIHQQIKLAIIAYNSSITKTTGFTPFELTFGHTSLKDPMEFRYSEDYYQQYINDHKERLQNLYSRVKKKNELTKKRYVEKSKEKEQFKEFKIGELVYVKNNTRNKLTNLYSGPYKIININNDGTIDIKTRTSTKRIHSRRLKHSIVTGSSEDASSVASD